MVRVRPLPCFSMSHRSVQSADGAPQLPAGEVGDRAALEDLRSQCHDALTNILRARGASPTEADDLLADLWADCVGSGGDRPSLLEKFSGKCSALTWLATVATRRLIDLRRSQARRGQAGGLDREPADGDDLDHLPAASAHAAEPALVDLLRTSLQAAFAGCPPEALVLLRLVYLHGLTQREITRMLRWSEAKLSRLLSSAMQHIETATLRHLKQRDPWLDLTWQDFVDLCETHQIGFL
jgi:RNA polymerase sigma factor (sigma-70 family)